MNRLLFPPDRPTVLTVRHYRVLALATLVLLVYGSLLPLQFDDRTLDAALHRFTGADVIDPNIAQARGDWIVSVVQYATLSFLAIAALAVDQPKRRSWEVAFLCFGGVALLAVVLEFVQCYTPRTVSVNDLFVETLGSAVGVTVWLAAGQRLTEWARTLFEARGVAALARLALPGYIAILLVVQLMPFDFVFGAAELEQKVTEDRGPVWLPFGRIGEVGRVATAVKTATNVACFGVLGLLTSAALQKGDAALFRGRKRAASPFLVAAPVGIEVLQYFLVSRTFDVGDIATGIPAALGGAWLGRRVETVLAHAARVPDGTRRLALGTLLTLWAAAVVVLQWHPLSALTTDRRAFSPETELAEELPEFGLRRMSFAPLVDYYWNDKYNALDQFAKKSLAFAPLGALVALWPRRRPATGAVLGVAIAAAVVALVVEVGQYYHPAHHPSVTDLLLGVFGATGSYLATRHVLAALRVPEPSLALRASKESSISA